MVSAAMVATWFDLPWKFGVSLAGGKAAGWEVMHVFVLAIAYAGPIVGSLLFLVLWLAIPVTVFVFLRTALSFSKADPRFFITRMLLGFAGAFVAFALTGYVPITWALYGIGALIIMACIRVLR